MKQTMRTIGIGVMAVFLLGGCLSAPELERIGGELASQYPDATFRKKLSVSLGSFTLGMARLAAGFSEDGREAREYLSGVRKVELAIYEIHGIPSLRKTRMPKVFDRMLQDNGWDIVIKAQEDDEVVWVLFREDQGKIRELQLTALDGNELVLIRVQGSLDELFQDVMEDHGGVIASIGRARR